jgi:hypothetical protein
MIPAISYVRENGLLRSASAKAFLKAALESGQQRDFFNTFRFFEQRNMFLYNSPRFNPAEECEVYEKHFLHMVQREVE